ncbi:lipocalin Cav p 3.0101-like [Ictidomys tridecemlineatus]
MKIFLLALGFGLFCVSSQYTPAEYTTSWRTILIASDDPQANSEDGRLRGQLSHLECIGDRDEIVFVFQKRLKKKCDQFKVVGKRIQDDVYEADYSGKNVFKIKYASDRVKALYNENTDKDGKVTHFTGLLGKDKSLSEEEQKKFEELTVEMNIPKENIRNVTDTDDCPPN